MDDYANRPGGCPCCEMDTAGNHAWNCPNNPNKIKVTFESVQINQGWECPRCKTIWSPEIKQCNCRTIVVDGGIYWSTHATSGATID